ncbi:O-antigen ligase family protein [Natranaerobius trueperi]|uniref:O-antigen ligase-related domain-containing protein n=1 Tax=Natranaerobius trueperi TaxID=759412 RepID=A0A226BW53_9FIRM|nr:O-antigen ligase family protein [Natranaerobius trueperi]OWZ83223.1 hypothetical protein CDO51_09585 [Natranaerobius trueperi]
MKTNKKSLFNNNMVLYILLIATLILIIYPPFYRGLFFDMDMLFYHVVSFLFFGCFLAYNLIKRNESLLKSPMDFILLGFCLVYGLSTFVAVTPREAVLEFLRVSNYFVIYLIVSRIPTNNTVKWLLYALVAAAVGVSFVGIGTALGSFEFPGAMVRNRIYSSLQYPNTTAAFLTAGSFVALSRVLEEKHSIIKAIFGGAGYFTLVTFVFTMSRGAWLFFPVVLLIFWALNFRRFINAFIYATIPGVFFLVTAMPLWEAIEDNLTEGWYYVVIGTIASGGLTFLFSYFLGGIEKLNIKPVRYGLIGILAVMILGVSFYGVTNYEQAMDYMPDVVERRIDRIDFDETGLGTRGELMDTAWDMIKDRPVLGAGGGGWEPLYHRYMERDYWATEVHSHIFQVGVETGIPGMLIFSGIWIALAYQLFIIWKKRREDFYNASGLFVAAIALGGHSMIDFNLSLGAVAVYLWAIFGLVTFYYRMAIGEKTVEEEVKSKKKVNKKKSQGLFEGDSKLEVVNKVFPYVMLVVTVVMLIYSSMVYSGYKDGQRASAAMEQGEIGTAMELYESAISRDSLNASVYIDLARAYETVYQETGEEEFIYRAIDTAERAIELNPEDGQINRAYGQFMLRVGNVDVGLDHLKHSCKAQPYNESAYITYANALRNVGENLLLDDDMESAYEYLEELIDFRDTFREYHSQSDEFDSIIFKGYVLLEQYEKAQDFLEKEEISLDAEGEILVYQGLLYDALDVNEELEEVKEEMEGEEIEMYNNLVHKY